MNLLAERLIAALGKDPNLLYAVLRYYAQHDPKLAGAWTREGSRAMGQNRRKSIAGKSLAVISRGEGQALPWKACLSPGILGGGGVSGERSERIFSTETEALGWCDEALKKYGFTLC